MVQINTDELLKTWATGMTAGTIVPIIGPDSHADCVNTTTGEAMPAQNNALIIAMNNGKPMSPKLMTEFSRAAMNLEFKRGRKYIERFLIELYENHSWSIPTQIEWIAQANPGYIIDLNRDSVLLDRFADRPHILIQGVARLSKACPRYRAYTYGTSDDYIPINEDTDGENIARGSMPMVFKPLGCARPNPSFIASDADYVDFITEMMGGFALPSFLKTYRKKKQYLIAGVRLAKDTERMVLRDIIYDADPDAPGWLIAENPTRKEIKFAEHQNLSIIEAPMSAFWPTHTA